MQIDYRRADGTFVAMINGYPYHVTQSDPLFAKAQEAGASAPFEPVPIPEPAQPVTEISFAQLLTGLVASDMISEAEGEAWLQGNALPMVIAAMVGGLPREAQFGAKAKLYRMSACLRSDPLVGMLAQSQKLTSGDVDQFFQLCASL